MKYWK